MGRGRRIRQSGARDLIEVAAVVAVLASGVGDAIGGTRGVIHIAALITLALLGLWVIWLVARGLGS